MRDQVLNPVFKAFRRIMPSALCERASSSSSNVLI